VANPIEDVKSRIVIGQLSMILYSVFAAVLGKTATTFILVFILIIIISILQNRSGPNPIGQKKTKPELVLAGRKIFEEEKAREIQMKDKGLMIDMQEQSRFTMYTSLGMLIAFIYFFVLWGYVDDLEKALLPYTGQGKLTVFLAFLIYFEGLFVINQLVYIWALRKVGTVVMIQAPSKYTITDKGIVIRGLTGGTALTFPLPDDVEINVNEKRKFVELIKKYKRTITKVRFYTKNPKRLGEVIRRYGFKKSS